MRDVATDRRQGREAVTTVFDIVKPHDPQIAPDGSYLIFTRWDDAIGWAETVDLYISFATGAGWSTPVALDELNSDGADFGAAISPDGAWLYYKRGASFRRVALDPLLERHRPLG